MDDMMRRRKSVFNLNYDSLLDTMTNVVGILVVILAVTQLSVGDTVRRIKSKESYPEVSRETLEQTHKEHKQIQSLLTELNLKWTELKARSLKTNAELERLESLRPKLKQLAKIPNKSKKELEVEIADMTDHLYDLEQKIGKIKRQFEINESKLASLIASQPQPEELRVPVLQTAPEHLKPVYFVCRNNKLYPLRPKVLMECLEKAMRKATGQKSGKIISNRDDLKKIEEYFQNHNVGDDHFQLKISVFESPFTTPVLLLTTKPHAEQGESIEQIQDDNSTYAKAIQALNSKSQFVKFYVWSNSFF